MELLKSVPSQDWAAFCVSVVCVILAIIQRSDRLPVSVRRWLKAIGERRVEAAVAYAAEIVGLTPDERRKEAALWISRISKREFGAEVPESIANLMIEYVYQRWKARRR